MYTSGEYRWESNMTFSVAHMSTIVLFYFASFSMHSSQHSSSTVAEAVDTIDQDGQFLQRWVDIAIVYNWACGHTPLVYFQECGTVLVINHVLVMLLSQKVMVQPYVGISMCRKHSSSLDAVNPGKSNSLQIWKSMVKGTIHNRFTRINPVFHRCCKDFKSTSGTLSA